MHGQGVPYADFVYYPINAKDSNRCCYPAVLSPSHHLSLPGVFFNQCQLGSSDFLKFFLRVLGAKGEVHLCPAARESTLRAAVCLAWWPAGPHRQSGAPLDSTGSCEWLCRRSVSVLHFNPALVESEELVQISASRVELWRQNVIS